MLNPIYFLAGSPSDSCVRSSTPRVMYSGPSFPSQSSNSTFPPPPWPGWKWAFLGLWLWEISGWVSHSFLEVDPILSTQSRPKEVSTSPESRTVLSPTPPLKSYKSHLHSLLLGFFCCWKKSKRRMEREAEPGKSLGSRTFWPFHTVNHHFPDLWTDK